MGGECGSALVFGWQIDALKMAKFKRREHRKFRAAKKARRELGEESSSGEDEFQVADSEEDDNEAKLTAQGWCEDEGKEPKVLGYYTDTSVEPVDGKPVRRRFIYVNQCYVGGTCGFWYLSLLSGEPECLPLEELNAISPAHIAKGRAFADELGAEPGPPKVFALQQATE